MHYQTLAFFLAIYYYRLIGQTFEPIIGPFLPLDKRHVQGDRHQVIRDSQ